MGRPSGPGAPGPARPPLAAILGAAVAGSLVLLVAACFLLERPRPSPCSPCRCFWSRDFAGWAGRTSPPPPASPWPSPPWVLYQRWYEPPGDRLLKWHPAGITEPDPRTAWEAIRDGYQGLGWQQILLEGSFATMTLLFAAASGALSLLPAAASIPVLVLHGLLFGGAWLLDTPELEPSVLGGIPNLPLAASGLAAATCLLCSLWKEPGAPDPPLGGERAC